MWGRPEARCRDHSRSVSSVRPPNPACDSHRTGISASAVGPAFWEWCVNKAYARSGLADLDWVAPALSAFNRGDLDVPAPFQDLSDASVRWAAEGYPSSDLYRGKMRPLSELRSPSDNDQGSLAYSALPSLFRARQSDSLAAVIGALSDASHTFGPAVDEFHNALMREFRKPRTLPNESD